jgi:choline dehydrogenase-like flavoprotein
MNTAEDMRSWDVIVIGSGAGGSAAAYRLATVGLRVLILEKGPYLPRDGSTLDVQRVVSDRAFISTESWRDGRGKGLVPEEHFNVGGKTKWYGAALLRFSPEEFLADDAFAGRAWPISHADLVRYYEEAEQLLGVRQFDCEPDLRRILVALDAQRSGWQSAPLPLAMSANILQSPVEATHFDGFASPADFKGEAESRLLSRIATLPNVKVRAGCEVASIIATGAAVAGVAGVRLVSGEELRSKIVLLGAGALHSPRLLQPLIAGWSSGGLPAAHTIGSNLKLHLLTALVAISTSPVTDTLRKTMLIFNSGYPHSSVQPLGFDAELTTSLIPRFMPRVLARQVGRHAYGFFLQTEDGSSTLNRVIERPVGPRAGHPERVLDYDATRVPESLREHREFTRAFGGALRRCGWFSFTQRVGLSGTAHACGTLIAGDDPDSSVVDASGRVHGVIGLYVADGSVLPRSSRVNPALSIYAWGLHVADQLIMSNGHINPVHAEPAKEPT